MTRYPDLFAALAAPFEPNEIRSRNQGNRQVQYITARTAMNRLDEVLGPENWWDSYRPGENSVICELTIRLPDADAGWYTLTKADAGGYAGMPDQGDDDKSGFSDAFKRAAVKFGVGRYLYRDGVPAFVKEREPAASPETVPMPEPALPPKDRGTWGGPKGEPAGNGRPAANGKPPASGRGLFAWCKEQEQKHEVGLVKYLNTWAKLQEFPGRMVDWDAVQIRQGYAEAVRKLQSVPAGHAEAYEEAIG